MCVIPLLRRCAVVLVAVLVGATVFLTPAAGSTPARTMPARCRAAHLTVVRGTTEGATSHRYTRFRVTNQGSSACRLTGYPRFQFRNARGALIGWPSEHRGTASTVVLRPGHHTRLTVGRVVTGVVERSACHPRRATSIDIKLAHRSHVWNVAYRARVCTTRQYRPEAFPVGY